MINGRHMSDIFLFDPGVDTPNTLATGSNSENPLLPREVLLLSTVVPNGRGCCQYLSRVFLPVFFLIVSFNLPDNWKDDNLRGGCRSEL